MLRLNASGERPSLVRSSFAASAFARMSVSSHHEGLCLRYPEPLGQQTSISYEAAVSLLLRAIQLAQHTPFVWGYIDKPQGSCARHCLFIYVSQRSPRGTGVSHFHDTTVAISSRWHKVSGSGAEDNHAGGPQPSASLSPLVHYESPSHSYHRNSRSWRSSMASSPIPQTHPPGESGDATACIRVATHSSSSSTIAAGNQYVRPPSLISSLRQGSTLRFPHTSYHACPEPACAQLPSPPDQ